MAVIIPVSLRRTRDIVFCLTGALDLAFGEKCLVKTENGIEIGEVVGKEKIIEKPSREIPQIIRKLTPQDAIKIKENESKKKQSLNIVRQKIKDFEMKMELVALDYTFDRGKLFIYYTAEKRVDFRQFVKELGYVLKTRIQMVQIGVRDRAKIIGGIGPCGRMLCCLYLEKIQPIQANTAKNQGFSQNPEKMCGMCGKLMCCLSFEENVGLSKLSKLKFFKEKK